MLFSVHRITRFIDEQLPKLMATLLDIEQVLAKNIDALNIADGSLITALFADGAVTPVKTSGGVARMTSGTYAGNGTANRIVDLGFTPRYLMIVRQSTAMIFEALSDGTTGYTYFQRDAAGAVTAAVAQFQGIVANGFKCGSDAAGGFSNIAAETYWYTAWR